jgi:hypothetical protein
MHSIHFNATAFVFMFFHFLNVAPFSKHQSHALIAFQRVLRNSSKHSPESSLPSLSSLVSSLRRDSFWFALFPSARAPWVRFVDAVSHGSRRRSNSDSDHDDDANHSDHGDDNDDNGSGDDGFSDEDRMHRETGDATLTPSTVDESERAFRSQIAEVYRNRPCSITLPLFAINLNICSNVYFFELSMVSTSLIPIHNVAFRFLRATSARFCRVFPAF